MLLVMQVKFRCFYRQLLPKGVLYLIDVDIKKLELVPPAAVGGPESCLRKEF